MKGYSKFLKQVFLFGIVGGVSFLIDVLVTSILFRMLGAPAYLAGSIGFMAAFLFNFPINRKHVFNHTKYDRFSLRTQIAMYATLSICNLFITAVCMHLLTVNHAVGVEYAKAATTLMIAVWNFLIFRFFVFSKHISTTDIERLSVQ